jgi:archaetidylinositol phosphate synthase
MRLKDMSGRTRVWNSWLQPLERYLVNKVVLILPKWLETNHLTLMSILWAILTIGVGFLARGNKWWLLGISALVLAQYITDVLDGAVGRYRNTGLVRWGFFMDHFLDYCFVCALVASYALAYHLSLEIYVAMSLIASSGFVQTALWANIQGEYNVSGENGFGSTEARGLVLVINLILPWFPTALVQGIWVYFVVICALVFTRLIFKTSQKLWLMDKTPEKPVVQSL